MQGNDIQGGNEADLIAAERAFQDHFIHERLPAWLRLASPEQLATITPALREGLHLRRQIERVLVAIEPLDGFVQTRLERALHERFGVTLDVRSSTFRVESREPVINQQPVGSHLTEAVYREMPLVEAALRNFTRYEAEPGRQPKGNRLSSPDIDLASLPSATEFAALCRELDLGARYQQHLRNVLLQPDPAQSLPSLLANARRQSMLVDAGKGCLGGVLTQGEFELIAQLCTQNQLRSLGGDRVVARQLSLFGCTLEQIVVLDVIDRGWLGEYSRRLLIHVPDDPFGAWSVFSSLRELAYGLGRRLRDQTYQYFFRRFVRRRDSQAFFDTVTPGYADLPLWANLDMHERLSAHPKPLFVWLGQAHVERIQDDAAVIAPPVAQLDREVQREHDLRLAAEGWSLVYLAGMFIPTLGAVLLAVTAWQLLGEIFQAIEDWQDGDHEQALDHVINVATDLALVGVASAGVGAASRAWQRSPLVDGLVPAELEDRSRRLWNQDLAPFRSAQLPARAVADEAGILRFGEATWIDMEGHRYPVSLRDGQWRLDAQRRPGKWLQPLKPRHSPRLLNNGAFAWRLETQQPVYWDDVLYLWQRLGGRFRALDREQAEWALTFHGLDGDDLRALHVSGRAPDTTLADTVERILLEQRIRDMVSCLRAGMQVKDVMVRQHAELLAGAVPLPDQALAELAWNQRRCLFQRIYQSIQASEVPAVRALRRAFANLPTRVALDIVDSASQEDQVRLLEHGRVSLNLAQAGRAAHLRIRTVRVYEALHLDTPQDVDLARVVLSLLDHLPATGIRWRLLDEGVPIMTTQGERFFDLIHLNGRFLVLDAEGAPVGETGELFEAMAGAYGEAQRHALQINDPFAHNLRVLITRLAVSRRQDVERLLQATGPQDWFNAPRRLGDGRIGYPLSGRGAGWRPAPAPFSLRVELRRFHPQYTDGEVAAWEAQVRQTGRTVQEALAQLGSEFDALRRTLNDWVLEGPAGETRRARTQIMDQLLRRWQRITDDIPQFNLREGLHSVIVHSVRPGVLPRFPEQVSFAHVVELSLCATDLRSVPAGFVRAFPNLRILQVARNRLTRIPPYLEQLAHLRELDLYDNQIELSGTQGWNLEHCEHLRHLNLSRNPLGMTFSVSRMVGLKRLFLRDTGIDSLPSGLLEAEALEFADLSGNRISRLPPEYYQASVPLRRVLRLDGNPLRDEDSQASRLFLRAGQQDVDVQRWSDALEAHQRGRMMQGWAFVQGQEGAAGFIETLQRLLDTREFQMQPRALAGRVMSMLESLQTDASLREALFSHAQDELTCHDSAILRFSNLEVRVLVARARQDTPPDRQGDALLRLGLRLWRLDQVDYRLLQDTQIWEAQGTMLEPLEVNLGYRLALREALDLPIEPMEMEYLSQANLSAERVARIRDWVLAKEQREQDALADWMISQSFWREYLTQTFAERFETLNAPFHERVASLLAWREDLLASAPRQPPGSDAAYQAQLARIDAMVSMEHQAQRTAEHALLLQLTQEAMSIGPAEPAIDV